MLALGILFGILMLRIEKKQEKPQEENKELEVSNEELK